MPDLRPGESEETGRKESEMQREEHEQRLLPEFFQKFLHKNPHINHL